MNFSDFIYGKKCVPLEPNLHELKNGTFSNLIVIYNSPRFCI